MDGMLQKGFVQALGPGRVAMEGDGVKGETNLNSVMNLITIRSFHAPEGT